MSTLARLSSRDVERLSAFLDEALSPAERRAVETRLASEPDLRAALEELQQVKDSLRALDAPRLPRNFTIRPEETPRRAAPSYPYLRFATALAVALFAATTGWRALSTLPRLAFGAAAPAMEPAADVAAQALPAAGAAASQPAEDVEPSEVFAALAEAGLSTPTTCPGCAPPAVEGEVQLRAAPTPMAVPVGGPEVPADQTVPAVTAESGADLILSPLTTVQWLLGLAAVALGALTIRARRRR